MSIWLNMLGVTTSDLAYAAAVHPTCTAKINPHATTTHTNITTKDAHNQETAVLFYSWLLETSQRPTHLRSGPWKPPRCPTQMKNRLLHQLHQLHNLTHLPPVQKPPRNPNPKPSPSSKAAAPAPQSAIDSSPPHSSATPATVLTAKKPRVPPLASTSTLRPQPCKSSPKRDPS
jgi:hypothetical protein